jgi:hypothetical protein
MTRHGTTQHNTTQHNTTQHNTTQHNTTQHNTAQHSTAKHNTAKHNSNLPVPLLSWDSKSWLIAKKHLNRPFLYHAKQEYFNVQYFACSSFIQRQKIFMRAFL